MYLLTAPGLSNAVSSGSSLEVVLWIEVRIYKDDGVRPGKIETLPTSSRAQEKDESFFVV